MRTAKYTGVLRKKMTLSKKKNSWQRVIPFSKKIVFLFEAFAITLLFAFVFYNNFLFSVFLVPIIPFYYFYRLKLSRKEWDRRMLSQFVDGIMCVRVGLDAGYSVENAFLTSISELENMHGEKSEIVLFFKKIKRRLSLNDNLEDILSEYADTLNLEDITMFSEVFRYAKRTGGDLNMIIRDTIDTIRDKTDTRSEIETMMSAKKLEAVIMDIVPICIILFLRVSAPELICRMYGNITGIAVMSGAVVAYFISVYMSVKIADIKV